MHQEVSRLTQCQFMVGYDHGQRRIAWKERLADEPGNQPSILMILTIEIGKICK